MTKTAALSQKQILRFWYPLALTWLMMAMEGPLIGAIVARLPDATFNLAAYGVAFSLGLIIEAPIIMILSAATALIKSRQNYEKLWQYTNILNLMITLIMAIILIPAVFDVIALRILGLEAAIAELTYEATFALLPWPAMIGIRRFYQGLMIRRGYTINVSYGTAIRLLSMFSTVYGLYYFAVPINGATVGALGLSVAVSAEALASYLMARKSVREVKAIPDSEKTLSFRSIHTFYYPLVLTSLIGLAAMPLATFFMADSHNAIASLAVFPVINSFIFIFRSVGLSYQEAGIKLMGDKFEAFKANLTFVLRLSAISLAVLILITATPLHQLWFVDLTDLPEELYAFTMIPTILFIPIPVLSIILSLQRAMLVNAGHSGPISVATGLEVGTAVILMSITVFGLDWTGIYATAFSFVIGRMVANAYLIRPCLRVLREARA
jgi:hypothetical protein